MEDNTLPWSLDKVESLISSLYEPGQPNAITEAQALLANFQSSPQAWILAHELLRRPDEKGKFFGALTIIGKVGDAKFPADVSKIKLTIIAARRSVRKMHKNY
ncbi:hypothetical protein VCV18_010091 [Metarhizium anisopliae]